MTYDEIEIEDMDWDDSLQAFTYQCPCGDLFQITMVRAHAFYPQEAWCNCHRAGHHSSPHVPRKSQRITCKSDFTDTGCLGAVLGGFEWILGYVKRTDTASAWKSPSHLLCIQFPPSQTVIPSVRFVQQLAFL